MHSIIRFDKRQASWFKLKMAIAAFIDMGLQHTKYDLATDFEVASDTIEIKGSGLTLEQAERAHAFAIGYLYGVADGK